jgi:3-hydroxyisobutyrate dehydrogenase-like beta-hydroxyacid dehydrogenase
MQKGNRLGIAFIGFGEVGQTFARDLLKNDTIDITAYDLRFDDASDTVLQATAMDLGVSVADCAATAARDASIVFSAVTASAAETVAAQAAQYLRAGQFFLDVNSAAPSTKQRAAQHVEATGASYVECAVMAPVMKPGLSVPILAGGPSAEAVATLMNALGMNLSPVALTFGRASAMKLCRSIMIKGLEALMVDCAAACEKQDVKNYVFASLAETFPSIDWSALADNMRERVATHGVRRSAEMREAGEMLASLGMDPSLANAVADAQLRGARSRRSAA